jgi:lysophospholipase L1-like esterase
VLVLILALPLTPTVLFSATESTWHSYDVAFQQGSPQARVLDTASIRTATIEFYESTNNAGVDKGSVFALYNPGSHPDAFNKASQVWSAVSGAAYPYAAKSTVNRGSDVGESNTPSPTGVKDLQLHPPSNAHLTVAAFQVPESGTYEVSGLGLRRVDGNAGQAARLRVFNAQKTQIANMQATSRTWVSNSTTYNLGSLTAGQYIYFAVDRDGEYFWDATEIIWTIKLIPSTPTPSCNLSVTPSSIMAGQSANLSWTSQNAASLVIDQGIGDVTPVASGSVTISPSATTTYTATASDPVLGSVTCARTITVLSSNTITGLGVMGDSMNDEYHANDACCRGGAYQANSFSWVELVANKQGINVGPWGTWGGTRRTGFQFNWALTGATARDVITGGQHTGLASQVSQGLVSHVVFYLGGNDFGDWNNTYQPIYNGTMSDSQLQSKINNMIADYTTAVDTVLGAGPVRMVIVNMIDRNNTNLFRQLFPDPVRRQRVTNAIIQLNSGLDALASSRGVALADLYTVWNSLWLNPDASGNVMVGGEPISVRVDDNEPHHMHLSDREHFGTVAGGLFANAIFHGPMNSFYGHTLTSFSEQDILVNAGIYTVPDDTPPTVSIASPVDGTSVTGTITITASASDNVRIAGVRFRIDGVDVGVEDTSAPYSVSWNTTLSGAGPHEITAVARDMATNSTTSVPTNVTVVIPTVYFPQSYVVNTGTYQSGNSASLVANDNNVLTLRSVTSGSPRRTITDFEFTNVKTQGSRFDYLVRLRSSSSSTTATIYAFNYSTSTWTQLHSSSVGTTESTKSASIAASANYVNAEGKSLVRVQTSRPITTHTAYLEIVQLTAQ